MKRKKGKQDYCASVWINWAYLSAGELKEWKAEQRGWMMANSLGIVSSFLSCVQAVITSVLSFHVGIAFGQGFFFSFCLSLLTGTANLSWKIAVSSGVLASGIYACWFHETHLSQVLTLVILILQSQLAALALILGNYINRSVFDCWFSPARKDIIWSQNKNTDSSVFLCAFWLLSCGMVGV